MTQIIKCGPNIKERNRMLHDPKIFEAGQRNDKEYNEMLKESVKACIKFKRDADCVLEIGSGTGLFSEILVPKFKNSHIFISEPDLMYLKIVIKKFHHFENIRYIQAMAEYVKYKKRFDLVIGTECYHHVPDKNKNKFFRNIFSLLNNSGIFVIGDNFIPRYKTKKQRIEALHKFWDPYIEAKRNANDMEGVKSFSDALKQAEEDRVEFKTSMEVFERLATKNNFIIAMKKELSENINEKGGYAVYVIRKKYSL